MFYQYQIRIVTGLIVLTGDKQKIIRPGHPPNFCPEYSAENQAAFEKVTAWFPQNEVFHLISPSPPGNQMIDAENIEYEESRDRAARGDLRGWLKRVGLPYSSPHKFKHGHIQWGLMHSKDRAQFKAISDKAIHSNTRITDEIFSSLKEVEIKSRIQSMGNEEGPGDSDQHVIEILESLLKNLKSK